MAERIDREELRQLIREALKEALGAPSPLAGEGWGGGTVTRAGGRHPSPSPSPSPQGGGEYRVGCGVLTEAAVVALAKTHSRIVVGAEVAVTPLARDRSRALKIEIVRQKP